jgi:hypothetical protein
MARRIFRWILGVCILAIGLASLYHSSTNSLGSKDVVQYWASGKLLIHHGNPYDAASVFLLEKQAWPPTPRAQVMFNPPSALLFALPLGLFGAKMAVFLWTLTILGCLLLSTRILWMMHGRRKDRLHLLIYIFAPMVASLSLGQIVPIALLGVVLFLWLIRDRPLLAGLCVPLLAVKPQLLLPFGAVVLLWTIKEKQYRFLSGVLLSFAAIFGVILLFDPLIFAHYLPVIGSASEFSHVMPNLSALLHALHPQTANLQYCPTLVATCWAIGWYLRKGKQWDWNHEGLLVIAVSVAVAPYSWFEDEVLMVPALLSGIYRCSDGKRSLIGYLMLDGAAIALVLFSFKIFSVAYIWTAPAWVGWILYARRVTERRSLGSQAA